MSDKKHNDPLEQFFKEKVSEHDISYQEDDWLALEKKLDEKAALLIRQRRIRLAAAAAILFISMLGYFTYQNYSDINSLTNKMNEQITKNETETSESEQNETNEQQTPVITGQSETKEPEVEEPLTTINDPITQLANDTSNIKTDIELTDPQNPEPIISTFPMVELVSVAQSDPVSSRPKVSKGNNITDIPLNSASVNANKPGLSYTEVTGNNIDTDLHTSRLNIGILVSPDLSTAGTISQFEQPGYKFGLKASYQLTSNISIETGIIQSSVRYSSGLQNYDPPPYWSNSNNLSSIYAECMILDIPINLTYNFWNLTNSRFFVSAGLSSYVMLSEDYTFNYDYSYPGQESNYSERSGKTHLFSNTGFSLGYEYDIHKNWSISAEPFIKVPLKEVGWGNVKLYSLGTFVTLNYRL